MIKRIAVKNVQVDQNLHVFSIGMEETPPHKSVGPCVRNKYVIHYIMQGRGSFCGEPLRRSDGFLICPDQICQYVSDADEPLVYGWISFSGSDAEKLLLRAGWKLNNCIFHIGWIDVVQQIFQTLCEEDHTRADTAEYLKGYLYILLSYHIKANCMQTERVLRPEMRDSHIQEAVRFIRNNYHHDIHMSDVAAAVCLSSHYVSNLFHDRLGISPQKYLLKVRMERAASLLQFDNLTVESVAYSVGYGDVFHFSKMFKRHFGVSPTAYRNAMKDSQPVSVTHAPDHGGGKSEWKELN